MDEQNNTSRSKSGKYVLHDRFEAGSVAALDEGDSKPCKQTYGHKGIITMDQEATMETITTSKATYVPPNNPVVRVKGARRELLEKQLTQMISEKVCAEMNPPPPKTEFCSTTQKDFCVQGFVPCRPQPTKAHDYKSDQAITFWSENHQRIQGVTPIQTSKAPFRKSTLFSTPITERLDEIDPSDN